MPKKELPFSEKLRDLILDMDLEYFLNEDLDQNQVSDNDRKSIKQAFDNTNLEIQKRYKKNKKQCRLWLEGIVRLQWFGGMLPAQFRIDGSTRSMTYIDYEAVGKDWAYFEFWQKLERKRRFWKITWDRIIKVGAILAILLTVLKVIDFFTPDKLPHA